MTETKGEETKETIQYVGLKETSFSTDTESKQPNGHYEPLVMEGPEEMKRQTSDLRNEVLLELAANSLKENDETIEHVQATAAVERAKERRNIVIWMHRITQILLYILPTLIVLCLILYWTIEDGKLKWLTMMAAVLGIACVVDFILFQYFTNRAEGTDLLNTVAIFRARLQKSGRRF
ncbi:uncharacterized protein LOC134819328 isoform X2 [Bolinopsis microptera]|uniref:uncharacterized protein LOC134819328 isoform X2 n=1 Tax=Bolinopsis microptera TaxID=2820187 RepID=UPI003079D2C9